MIGRVLGIAPGDDLARFVASKLQISNDSAERIVGGGFRASPLRRQFSATERATSIAAASTAPDKPDPILAELRAWKRGMEVRAQYHGRTMGGVARELGYEIEYVPGRELKGSTPTWLITGRSIPMANRIWVAADLPFDERERVIAHEIAHCLGLGADLDTWDCERACESFAFGLVGR